MIIFTLFIVDIFQAVGFTGFAMTNDIQIIIEAKT